MVRDVPRDELLVGILFTLVGLVLGEPFGPVLAIAGFVVGFGSYLATGFGLT